MKSVNIYVKSRKRISTCQSHLFQIVCNLCPGWLLCLMRMTSSKQGEFKLKEIFIFWSTWLPCHDNIQASDIMYLYFSWLSDDPISGLTYVSLINRYSYWSQDLDICISHVVCRMSGRLTQVMAQPSRLLEKLKIKSRNCHISFGKKSPESLIVMWYKA